MMTPREQLRKMTALGEQGALDEKHWYRLVSGVSASELRQRQEMIMRNQMAMAPQILAQGQQRLQGVPAQFEPRFMERDLVPPAEMVAPEARQMHMAPHLGPPLAPHAGVLPGRTFPGAGGYGFLPPEPMETVARRQELIHKQNMARMEMNAILHQKELENAHQKGLMGMETPLSYPSNPMAFRGRQRMPEGHDVFVHRPTLDDLHSGSLLMSAGPYPPVGTLHRERGRRVGRRPAAHKSADNPAGGTKGPAEDKSVEQSPGAASGGEDKEGEVKGDAGEEGATSKVHHHHHHHHHQQSKVDLELAGGGRKSYKEGEAGLRKTDGCQDVSNSGAGDKDGQSFQEKFMYPPAGMPYVFPVTGNAFLPPGPPNLFLNGDEVSEDVRKWSVNDVYNFVSSFPACAEYAQTFKDHMIDGETLPLLSEEHLLDTLGLKLGPALKIRSQVSRRMGSVLYMMNLPLSAAPDKPGDRSSEMGSPVNCNSEEMMASPRDTDVLKASEHLHETDTGSPPPAGAEAVVSVQL
ncbi:sterile alpha motif domain-containing protein 7 [Dunckerocampus dactyliophorus]|uniref:sterile alpha motif domain-containing protein 7 n=1 Tax=Dunckerocampus dactyliophorus TaxID=161453 RepID=UPI002404B698|nr:sterile alpha motif domain-containing protein 7 [Dunckerocampus dactyliophorus]XP_054614721.1 sterile alpha motif domain-containing protein 7 [Dunckerocampus dactyliophorus]XP_054614730.1 sterile alpha motif domain-containing protein 7 [Dunckerocampus dactyliophorus]XP_054614738.1 sterile alpha motif domain-containing protein 7 [Dunckerocampus dactyliophorus]XP_054614746.1 sterile alpha motif domain-containing protein 7 [Dunckerocampus dactyliophorus]XP_054614755.1 sterile alpha motif domai